MKVELKILDKTFYNFAEREDIDDEMVVDLPNYTTEGSAAMDLVCTKDTEIAPGEVQMIPTGLAMWINNPNVAALIMPRSGLGTQGLILANTVGLIDSDYQGELMVSAWNRNEVLIGRHSFESLPSITLKAGSRFAQMLFVPILRAEWDFVDEFSDVTERGEGGFNSTGV